MTTTIIPLGELVNIQTGKLDANASSTDGAYPFFTCAREPLQIAEWKYDLDAILIAGNGDLNVKHYNGKFDAYQRTYILDVKDTDVLDSRFLFHFLDKYVERLREQSIGGIIKYIKLGMLTDAQIPLPPLEEQKRIAGILDQADALRRLRTRALEKLNTLGQAIFHEMFGDPILNERKWPSAEIGKTAIKISDGNYAEKYPKASDFIETGVPFIRANNIRNGTVIADDLRYISVKKHELLKKGHLQTGDVLITTRGKIGNLAVVPKQFHDANINAQLVLMRCVDKTVQPDFLYYQLSQQSFQIQFEKIQTGVALKQLPVGRLKQLSIILPPLNLQNDFAEKMHSILKQHEHFESVNQKFTSLFASLQHRAFRGEL